MDDLPATFGKYYLAEKLATGGMAEIYLGKILGPGGFEKQLVIKQIHPRLTGQRQFVDMFVAEAKTLVGLTHGNIVPVYELGVVDDIYFIAMEYIDGPTLYRFTEAAARRGLQLPTSIAAWIAAEILEGLDYAHRKGAGVIHRDLSPRNVMLSRDGEVKLVDFGIAVSLGATGDSASSAPTGSFPYMSPEQVRREALDGQSDLFSVGVLLWEMLTGQRLFARANAEDTLAAVLEGDILLPSTIRPSVPARLDETVAIALNRTKSQRWETAGDFLAALNRHLYSLEKAPSARDLAPLVARLCPPELRRVGTEGGAERADPSVPFMLPSPDAPSTAVMPRDGVAGAVAVAGGKPATVQRSFATNVGWKQLLEKATPLLGVPAITDEDAPDTGVGGPKTQVTPKGGPVPVATSARSTTERAAVGEADAPDPAATERVKRLPAPRGADEAQRAPLLPRRFLIAVGLIAAATAGVFARLACTGEEGGVEVDAAAVVVVETIDAASAADAAVAIASPDAVVAVVKRPRIDARTAAVVIDARVTVASGTLKVGADPWGTIVVDGKSYGRTPKSITLSEGRHELVVEFPASDPPQRQARSVEVKAGVVTAESFTFTP